MRAATFLRTVHECWWVATGCLGLLTSRTTTVQPVSSWFTQSRITERTKDQKKATTSRHISRHRRNLQAPTVCCKDIKEEIPVPHSLSSWANSLHSPYTPCSPPQTLYSSTNSVHFNTHFLCPSLLPAVLCWMSTGKLILRVERGRHQFSPQRDAI